MFDWFWRFLYSISEILFELIDGLMSIANMLCGIEPITVNSTKTDFLSYLLNNDKVMYGFIGSVFVGIFLVMVFSIFAMMKAIKGKNDLTPARVAINVVKTLGVFLFVPFVMLAFTAIVNELMIVLYKATSMGANSMGDFLFKAFLPSGLDAEGAVVDYTSVASVESFMDMRGYDLDEYRFFFSWLCCIPLLFALAKGLLNFVDRTISIVLLFIASPISISTSIIDDGAHFKLWRDQVLVKFLTGYGIIIGLNVYILIVSIISDSSVVFFENSFLNFLFKVAFCLGGAFSLERTMALVGNLVSSGAGSNEMRDAALAYNSMAGAARAVGGIAKGIASAPISAMNFKNDVAHMGLGDTIKRGLGLRTDKDYERMRYGGDNGNHGGAGGSGAGGSGSDGSIQDQVMDAITGGGSGDSGRTSVDSAPSASSQNSGSVEDKNAKNKSFEAMMGMTDKPTTLGE